MLREHMMALSPAARVLIAKVKISISALFNVCYYCSTNRNLMGPTEFHARRKHAVCKEQLKIVLDGFLDIFVLFLFLLFSDIMN